MFLFCLLLYAPIFNILLYRVYNKQLHCPKPNSTIYNCTFVLICSNSGTQLSDIPSLQGNYFIFSVEKCIAVTSIRLYHYSETFKHQSCFGVILLRPIAYNITFVCNIYNLTLSTIIKIHELKE